VLFFSQIRFFDDISGAGITVAGVKKPKKAKNASRRRRGVIHVFFKPS